MVAWAKQECVLVDPFLVLGDPQTEMTLLLALLAATCAVSGAAEPQPGVSAITDAAMRGVVGAMLSRMEALEGALCGVLFSGALLLQGAVRRFARCASDARGLLHVPFRSMASERAILAVPRKNPFCSQDAHQL